MEAGNKTEIIDGEVYLRAEHMAVVDVECYNRRLVVFWDGDTREKRVREVLEERYMQWVQIDVYPEVEPWCCEEWMLMGLDEIGLVYFPAYVSEPEEPW